MPRTVLSWLKCALCGRSPAVEQCNDLAGGPLCNYCYAALRGLGVCGGGPATRRPARHVDVDERLIESLRSRRSRRRRS